MRRLLLPLLLLAPVGAVAGPSPAPAPVMPSPLPARAAVVVHTVVATRDGARMDPRLAEMSSVLLRTGFTSFSSAGETRLLLADGATGAIELPDGRTVRLTLGRHLQEEAHVVLRTERPGTEPVETALSVRRNRAFLYAVKTQRPDSAFLLMVDVRY